MAFLFQRSDGTISTQREKVSVTQLGLTLCDSWTIALQAPLSMGFSRQESWSGLPCPSPGDLPYPGIYQHKFVEFWVILSEKLRSLVSSLLTRCVNMRSSVQSLSHVSLRLHEPQHTGPHCPSPTPEVHPNPCPLNWWCHPTISSSVIPFSSCPQSFPASESFQLHIRWPSIGVSASTSILSMNTWDWSPLVWNG